MSLAAGTKLGPYQIESALAAGGMGTSTLTQLYQRFSFVWWAKPSNWVPTWPISLSTVSSLEPRRLLCGFMNVRFV